LPESFGGAVVREAAARLTAEREAAERTSREAAERAACLLSLGEPADGVPPRPQGMYYDIMVRAHTKGGRKFLKAHPGHFPHWPKIQEYALQLFEHSRFSKKTRDRLDNWLLVKYGIDTDIGALLQADIVAELEQAVAAKNAAAKGQPSVGRSAEDLLLPGDSANATVDLRGNLPAEEPPKLPGVRVDRSTRAITREGDSKPIDLSRSPVSWHIFITAWDALPNAYTQEELAKGYPGADVNDRNAKHVAKYRLNCALHRIGLTVTPERKLELGT
jgi:hypothetical protein